MAKYLPLEIHENIFKQLDVDTQFSYAVALHNQRLLDIAVKNKLLQQATGRNTEDCDSERLEELESEFRAMDKVGKNVYPFLTSFFQKTFIQCGTDTIYRYIDRILSNLFPFAFRLDMQSVLDIIIPGIKTLTPKLNKEQRLSLHNRILTSAFNQYYKNMKEDKIVW